MLRASSAVIILNKRWFPYPSLYFRLSRVLDRNQHRYSACYSFKVVDIFVYKHSGSPLKTMILPLIGNYFMKKDSRRKKLIADSYVSATA